MIPRTPSLFQIQEGTVVASTSMPDAASSGELVVGLRLIIQPSPWPRLPAVVVVRRSAVVRAPSSTSASSKSRENGWMFAGLEFLRCCFGCHMKLGADMDVFVYKGEQAFCSADCRSRHIAKEERREMAILVRKRRDAFHSRRHAAPAKTEGSDSSRRHLRLQIAA